MRPFVFERTTRVDAALEPLYRFHADPRNIRKIAPPGLVIEQVEGPEEPLAGDEFFIALRQFGIPLRWRGVWEKAEFPNVLVDGARESPFTHWRHSHIFEKRQDGVFLTDRVECGLGSGVLGALLTRIVMPFVLGPMFAARHAATRRFFSVTGD